MRIGFDAKRLFNNFTGLGNYSRTLLRNLAEFYPENDYFLYTPSVKKNWETFFFLQSQYFKTHQSKAFIKSHWRSFSIKNQLENNEIDVYHGLSHEIPFFINKTSVKSIVTIHDLIFKKYPELFGFFDKKIYDYKFRYACENADEIIAISENTKKDIIDYYGINPKKIEVIYQACNPIYYKLQSDAVTLSVLEKYNLPKDYLLFVGTLEPRKNIKVIIDAYRHLRADLQLPLVIVGRGKMAHEIKMRAAQNDILEKIFMLDKLDSNEHLQAIYQQAQAMIYPSFYEGFGLPIAEALVSRTPVIAADSSSLPEAGGKSTLYFNPENAEELADCIEKVITDSTLKKSMIENGFHYAHQTFGREEVTKKIINKYEAFRNMRY